MSRFNLLLASCLVFGMIGIPAEAKKEFAKPDSAKKPALGAKTVTLPSGLQYTDDVVGTGTVAQLGNVCWIDYTGWVMPDKVEFDSTRLKGRPMTIVLGGALMCKGVDDGVLGMKVGGKRTLLVPPALGFTKGTASSKLITPESTLKYEITLVHVGPKLPKKPAAAPAGAKDGKPTEKPN